MMEASRIPKVQRYQELVAEVQAAYLERTRRYEQQTPPLENERGILEEQCKGWAQSLAKAELPVKLREHIEAQYNEAIERIEDIDIALAEKSAHENVLADVIAPSAVEEQLSRLAEVLAKNNPSMGNIELAHHIDRIDCFGSGKIVVRTCTLGVVAGAVDFLANQNGSQGRNAVSQAGVRRVKPRRLTRRRLDSGEPVTEDLKARAAWATDPQRFADLDERWFEERVFTVPKRLSWVEEHAPEVAARRKLNETEQQLAEHFGKSLPTIRAALRIARKTDPELRTFPRRMPRARWHEEHALEVAAKKAAGLSIMQLAVDFGLSDTTIRSALNHAKLLATQQGDGPEAEHTD
jgi:hypothetical protein